MESPTPRFHSSPDSPFHQKWKAVVLCLTWGLLVVQGGVPAALGQVQPADEASVSSLNARVTVTSDPEGQAILVDGKRNSTRTPAELELSPGQYFIVVNADGFQPLSHELTVALGEHIQLDFILLKTPPEPPTPDELRALSPPFGADDPNSNYWAEAGPREMANESCRDCHSSILTLHAQGEHRTFACTECHGLLADHVTDDKVTAAMPVIRGEGIQNMCLMCHDQSSQHQARVPARTIDPAKHLRQLRVLPHNRCEECHHVHDPMKWVHEAREIVGVPEKMAMIPMLDEAAAAAKRQQYESMAETFFVFPLVPGIIGVTALAGSEDFPAEALLYSGMVLVLGSYLLGERAFNRELTKIRMLNDERRSTNLRVKEHNRLVKEALDAHAAEVALWINESDNRGVVKVSQMP